MKNILLFITILLITEIKGQAIKEEEMEIQQPVERKERLLGGYNDVNPENCKEPLLKALQLYGYGKKINFPFKITKCRKQTIFGFNYDLDLLIYGKNCKARLFESVEEDKGIYLRNVSNYGCFTFKEKYPPSY
jgi:hypothetical protein